MKNIKYKCEIKVDGDDSEKYCSFNKDSSLSKTDFISQVLINSDIEYVYDENGKISSAIYRIKNK